MSHSVLDVYLLSLIDRGVSTRYELQRRGGVSLGSSTPALKRLLSEGLITEQNADDGTLRVRQVLKVTPAGRRIARQGWLEHFRNDATLDLEAILRVVDLAEASEASTAQIAEFLNAMAEKRSGQRNRPAPDGSERAFALQQEWTAARSRAEADFLYEISRSVRTRVKRKKTARRSGTGVVRA